MNKKYEFVKEDAIKLCGEDRYAYRIRALRDFRNLKAGDLGGYIENERNLSHEGDCWVADNAYVIGNAVVFENALVANNAVVKGEATVFGNSYVFGNSVVSDGAKVFGNAQVYEEAQISGKAKISGDTMITGEAIISGDASIYENACVTDKVDISGNVKVFGDAMITGEAIISGDASIYGKACVTVKADISGNVKVFEDTRADELYEIVKTECEDFDVLGIARCLDEDSYFYGYVYVCLDITNSMANNLSIKWGELLVKKGYPAAVCVFNDLDEYKRTCVSDDFEEDE